MDKEKIKELTLLLMYLTSWEEKQFDEKATLSWKGYNFDILKELDDEELIFNTKRIQPVYLSETGIEKAKELMKKYNI